MEYKIGVLSPSQTMSEKFQTAGRERNLRNLLVRQGKKDEMIRLAQELAAENVRVFISRGRPALIIRNMMDVPVVDVKYTFFDCHSAYLLARRHGERVAFLATHDQFIKCIRESLPLLDGAELVHIRDLDNLKAIDGILLDLRRRGVAAVVGGLTLQKRAEAFGFKYIMTQTDTNAVHDAMEEALHLLRIEMERDERAQELEKRYETIVSIFQCVSDGVISIDREGIITNANKKAVDLLGEHINGRAIAEALQTGMFTEILRTGAAITREILNVNHHSLVVNAEPIRVNNEIGGATVTLQQSKNILAAEQKIRSIMIDKGHQSNKTFDDIVGASAVLRDTKTLARKYAAATGTVLLLGETGTGKELFAQSIHNASNRRSAPFVAINCASLPLNILESELFGYVKGAFTGAKSEGKAGFFELAHHGTMFLDEISEMSLDVQLKLLRVIQERKTMRIGDDKLLPIDVRIITASNKDLTQLIRKGLFREDLFYRICVLELRIPPLRERREDIPSLVRHFMRQHTPGITSISQSALDLIASRAWPGNIRQLQNLIERIGAVCEGDTITCEVVEKSLGVGPGPIEPVSPAPESAFEERLAISAGMTEMELIRKVLTEVKGNRRLAAKHLGISTTTLWRIMKRITDKDAAYFDLVKYGTRSDVGPRQSLPSSNRPHLP